MNSLSKLLIVSVLLSACGVSSNNNKEADSTANITRRQRDLKSRVADVFRDEYNLDSLSHVKYSINAIKLIDRSAFVYAGYNLIDIVSDKTGQYIIIDNDAEYRVNLYCTPLQINFIEKYPNSYIVFKITTIVRNNMDVLNSDYGKFLISGKVDYAINLENLQNELSSKNL